MLNRKVNKASNGHPKTPRSGREQTASGKARPVPRRFVISSAKPAHSAKARVNEHRNGNGHPKPSAPAKSSAPLKGSAHPKNAAHGKGAAQPKTPGQIEQNATFTSQASSIDLTETI